MNARVTVDVLHIVYKFATQSSFSVKWRHKANGGTWMFCH